MSLCSYCRFGVLTTAGAWLALSAAQAQTIVINEIMYHPASTNLLEQWFEVLNTGSQVVDLSGWRVTDDVAFTFPTSTTLAAGSYLVVAADRATFAARHPTVTNVVAGWTGVLHHHLKLEDATGKTVNAVAFYHQGDWAVRRLGPAQFNHLGWEWYAAHDGHGASLELVNPALPNSYAQNWASSTVTGGTPGRANSVASMNTAPFIADVAQRPIIPQPSDSVTVSARIVDEQTNGLSVTLHWRVDGTADFTSVPMRDDGAHGDGVAVDGLYGAILSPQPNGTVVEFYLQARDAAGHVRTYPAYERPTNSVRTANLLYQVDNSVYSGSQPIYRIIVTEAERQELYELGRQFPDADSDAQMNATWIASDGVLTDGTTTQLRYNVGVRNRGHGTRTANPNNYHINIPGDRLWHGLAGIDLNSHYAFSQVLGSAVFRRVGLPMPESRPVQVRVNGTNLMATVGSDSFGSYAANEQYNHDFVQRAWPLDPNGNSYRGIRGATMEAPSPEADFSWHGSDFFGSGSYTNAYFKQNNFIENDWSDLISLIGVLSLNNGTTSTSYVADVQRVLNVDEWMKYMAVNTLLDNNETCLANGVGDDYALYRGNQDTRFLVLPYDLDTLMGDGKTRTPPHDGILRMTGVAAMNRFMKTPEFAPLYFRWLETLAQTMFAPAQMNPLLDQVLGNYVPVATLENLKAFNSNQVAYVLSQFPHALTVTTDLSESDGYPRATTAMVALHGTGDAVNTRSIWVNGTAATWTAWQGEWSAESVMLHPGVNRVLIQALGEGGTEIGRTNLDIWYDDGSVQTVGGTITSDTTWTADGGPYEVSTSLTINDGATLTVEPGTTVYLNSGVSLNVADGGRLLAEGTAAAPICFTRAPGSGASWGGISIHGSVGSPETRITYAHIEFNGTTAIHSSGGTVFLDHLTFGTTSHQYVSLDDSSFVVSYCNFPTPTAAFELAHGTGGIKSGGHGLFIRNFFGVPNGYNDVVDFTGGQRPGPIVQFIDNVFMGASDDVLDLDNTDAWVEHNIFLHIHKNGAADTSSAVSGGNDTGEPSEITILGNLIYDCDQAALAKQGNFYTLINNTVARQTHQGGEDTDGAIICMEDHGMTEGKGAYLEGNIFYNIENLTRNVTDATVTFTNNLMPLVWNGPGGGNSTNAPLFQYVPQLSETYFTSWEQAQIMRQWFSLRPGSPGRGTGPNGADMGGVIPLGVSLSGVPVGTNNETSATIRVGVNRSGGTIPVSGWPDGSGYTDYRWRLDGGSWSAETPITTPLLLTRLTQGPHQVEVSGKRDSGWYQDDPLFETDAQVTVSGSWVVDTNFIPPAPNPTIRLNEVLARNSTTFTNLGTTPDLIELYNDGTEPVDLTGMGLTDNVDQPYKYVFPAGSTLAPGAYWVLCADSAVGGAFSHTGFALKESGDDLSLFDRPAAGGVLLDEVRFGVQIADLSIGRRTDGTWGLCLPTFGAPNIAVATGDPSALRINEWLTDAQFVGKNDFVELYNSSALPVALGGLYWSDAAGSPTRQVIAPLSYIAAQGFVEFIADGQPGQGADHLDFKLSPQVGLILLSTSDLTPIDAITYGPQRTDVSEGRSPDGANTLTAFAQPTPGAPNPGVTGGGCSTITLTEPLLPITATWHYNQTANLDGVDWTAADYDDSSWPTGPALLAVENCNCLPEPGIQTPLTLGRLTYYFRTRFVVATNLAGFNLNLTTVLDDGAVIYLNGERILSPGMGAGTPNYSDYTTRTIDNATLEYFSAPGDALVSGTNVLAVEVHQHSSNSSDIVWGMGLDATLTYTNCAPGAVVPVVLNEVLASNHSLTNAAGATADYVELYNGATNDVDLADLSLTDDLNFPRKWVFPPGSSIAAGGTGVVRCDSHQPISAENTGFSLSAKGGALYFFNTEAAGGGLVDAIRYGIQIPDFSIGRVPNGTGNWTLTVPTPGSANAAAGLGNVSGLRINEWMADPVSGSDWFELFNSADQPVPLGGLFLTDDLGNPTQSPIAPLSFVGTGTNAFALFLADGNPGAGADHVSFALKKSGESIGLFAPNGAMLDGLVFGPQQVGVSQGRFPDGTTNWVSFVTTSSPGASNYLAADTDNDGLPDAWEMSYFGTLARDGTGDFDGDGMTDAEEYLAGTNPVDPNDNLRLQVVGLSSSVTLEFEAVAARSYTVQYRGSLSGGSWQKLTDVPAPESTAPVTVQDITATSGVRFYRVVTPAQP